MSSPNSSPASPTDAAPTRPKTFKSILTIAIIFAVVPALGVMLLWHGRCAETLVTELPSPDHKYTAQLAYKDCGASQPVATLVRIFAADGSRTSENLLLTEGKFPIEPSWTDAETLALAVPKEAKVVYRRHVWEGIKLTFADR